MKKILYTILLFPLLLSCIKEDMDNNEGIITVEGYIEKDSVAKIILTRCICSKDYGKIVKTNKFSINDAVITVSSNDECETLVCVKDSTAFGGYIYISKDIIGKENNRYDLVIKYKDRAFISSTYIYPPPKSCFELSYLSDKIIVKGQISSTNQNNKYLILERDTIAKDFTPSFLGVANSEDGLNDSVQFHIFRSCDNFFLSYNPLYSLGTNIEVKVSQVSDDVYEFWESYFIQIAGNTNPFIPSITNVKSNIVGAYGYWQGINGEVINLDLK